MKLNEPKLKIGTLTEFAQAMPKEYRSSDIVKAYRDYYLNEKDHIATWKIKIPNWWENN